MGIQYFGLLASLLIIKVVLHQSEGHTINKTNILYQYSLVCGVDFDPSDNVWNFPRIPRKYRICPDCSHRDDCYLSGNCCPDKEIDNIFPNFSCKSIIIYGDFLHYETTKYRLVSSCPKNSNADLTEKCEKNRSIKEKIFTPPVMSKRTGKLFYNRHCAICNNVTDIDSWYIRVNHSCEGNLSKTSPIDEIVKKITEGKCGSIKFTPKSGFYPDACYQKRHIIVNTCNVSGTWLKYDKDVDFACRSFGNEFQVYKNVFCYLCNPPFISVGSQIIGECNVTGDMENFDEGMEHGCRNGGLTLATYPYKNIYCYLCNSGYLSKNAFYSTVNSNKEFEYYFFQDSIRNDNSYPEIKQFETKSTIAAEFHVWTQKIICKIPIGVLDNTESVLRLSERNKCSKQKRITPGFSLRVLQNYLNNLPEGFNISDKYIDSAVATNFDKIFLFANGSLIHFSYCSAICSLWDMLHISLSICLEFDTSKKIYRYPLEYLHCYCCRFPTGALPPDQRWNIFHITAYDTPTSPCGENQILDKIENICREIKCSSGLVLRKGKCKRTGAYVAPKGYTLPFSIEVEHCNSEKLFLLKKELEYTLYLEHNVSAVACLFTELRNSCDTLFIHLDIKTFHEDKTEKGLLDFVSNLTSNTFPFTNITYDSKTRDYVTSDQFISNESSVRYLNNSNSEYCNPGPRPLLSNLLTCTHIVFNEDEFKKDKDQVKINGYSDNLNFHEYYIKKTKLWVCRERFNKLSKRTSDSNVVYFIIMLTCSALSIIFLSFTLLTYSIFPVLRTVPGKNIMSLIVSLLLHHVTFIIFMTSNERGISCKFLGIVVHYFLLTCFGSLFICAVHMFKIFGTDNMALLMEASRNNHLTRWYLIFTYCYAFILIIVNIVVTLSVTSGKSIGYGDNLCFISYKVSVIVTLIVPLVVLSVADIVLYSMTVYRFKRRPKMKCDESMNKKDLIIFLKLFVTTGCSWILLLVNVFINNPIMAVIIAGLNNLQGVYIFIAYICNKRILNMYRSKIRYPKCVTNQSPSTSTTSLSQMKPNTIEQLSPLCEKKTELTTEEHASSSLCLSTE